MTNAASPWVSEQRARVRELQDGLLSTAAWAAESAADAESTDLLLQPFREQLEALYEYDLPLARLADDADILLHVRGPSAAGPNPRVSVLTKLLTQTRDQVTRLAKQLGGVTTVRVPPSLDMGFVGVAGGSLFIGFSADATDGGELTREAVRIISDASWLVSENRSVSDLANTIEDPAARDMAVAAVRHLSPSGQLGIREVEIFGKQVAHQVSLTTETRRQARGIMAQRAVPASTQQISFIGTVRELDLDASRFEIRNVEGYAEDIRCAHELEEGEVKPLVDRRVRVTGKPELGAKGIVRLLWVDEVELLP
jgi:hypothetical protein